MCLSIGRTRTMDPLYAIGIIVVALVLVGIVWVLSANGKDGKEK